MVYHINDKPIIYCEYHYDMVVKRNTNYILFPELVYVKNEHSKSDTTLQPTPMIRTVPKMPYKKNTYKK